MFDDIRVWDADVGEMYFSHGLHHIVYGGASDDIGLGIELHWSVKNSDKGWYRKRNFKEDLDKGIIQIMPFIGATDYHDIKIYKNDLINVTDAFEKVVTYEVVWSDYFFSWGLRNKTTNSEYDEMFMSIIHNPDLTCVVVGNTCGKIQRQNTFNE